MHILVAAVLLAATTIAAEAAHIAWPGCQSRCGDVDIPYPFGTDNCYHRSRSGFQLKCHRRSNGKPDRLWLPTGGGRDAEVLEISVPNSTVRIRSRVWLFGVDNTTETHLHFTHSGKAYVLSQSRNRLVHTGCGFRANSWHRNRSGFVSTCSSSCPAEIATQLILSGGGGCNDDVGFGCCSAPVPEGGLNWFRAQFQWNVTEGTSLIRRNASLVAVESEWWSDKKNVKKLKKNLLQGNASRMPIPAILDWSFDHSTCIEAAQRPDYGCVSKNSECHDSTGSAKGYVCWCSQGYQGNPYLNDGCQRTTGPSTRQPSAGKIFAKGVFIGMSLLLMVIGVIYILDVQVIEEGEEEAKQVAAVAALCLQIKGDDRPTMRQVETVLQGIQSSNDCFEGNPGMQGMGLSNNTIFEGSNVVVHDNNSRRFSMEREMLLSATFP
ncbi:hypothetical protein EJB05_54462, partial [Eragrostis curvula]